MKRVCYKCGTKLWEWRGKGRCAKCYVVGPVGYSPRRGPHLALRRVLLYLLGRIPIPFSEVCTRVWDDYGSVHERTIRRKLVLMERAGLIATTPYRGRTPEGTRWLYARASRVASEKQA